MITPLTADDLVIALLGNALGRRWADFEDRAAIRRLCKKLFLRQKYKARFSLNEPIRVQTQPAWVATAQLVHGRGTV